MRHSCCYAGGQPCSLGRPSPNARHSPAEEALSRRRFLSGMRGRGKTTKLSSGGWRHSLALFQVLKLNIYVAMHCQQNFGLSRSTADKFWLAFTQELHLALRHFWANARDCKFLAKLFGNWLGTWSCLSLALDYFVPCEEMYLRWRAEI